MLAQKLARAFIFDTRHFTFTKEQRRQARRWRRSLGTVSNAIALIEVEYTIKTTQAKKRCLEDSLSLRKYVTVGDLEDNRGFPVLRLYENLVTDII